MMCDTVRSAMAERVEADWPPDAIAHLAECDECARIAVEQMLQRPPAVAIPATFAADVARRARLETPPAAPSSSGLTAGVSAAAVVSAAAAWHAGSDPASVLPAAVLLLACGEAIVLAAWTLHSDVTRARWRR
jgi:hypothetical protein